MLLEEGQLDDAIAILNELVSEDGQNGEALLLLARAAVQKGENASAEALLAQLPEEQARKPEAAQLKGLIHFSKEVDSRRTFAELNAAVESGEADSETRYQHALQLCLQGQFEPAMEALLKLMLRDREYGDDAARKLLINVFDVLGSDPLVSKYRRRLFAMMH
jgi:putative thioredoxin